MMFFANAAIASEDCDYRAYALTVEKVVDLFLTTSTDRDSSVNSDFLIMAKEVAEFENCIGSEDYELYFYLVRLASDSGDYQAMNDLAYNLEAFSRSDKTEIMKLFETAANKGNLDALYNLGYRLYESDDKLERSKGLKYLLQASKQGHLGANNYLGHVYAEGSDIVDSDINLAVKFYRRAMELGDSDSAYNYVLYKTQVTGGLDQEGLNILSELSQSDADAALYLGIHYAGIEGLEDEALEYFKIAVKLGDKSAFFFIGKLYEQEYKDIRDEQYLVYSSYIKLAEIYGHTAESIGWGE